MKGWVYFARLGNDGPIKIGRSAHPRRRVADLSCLSPQSITLLAAMSSLDAALEEKQLHTRLKADRIKGEWFNAPVVLEEMQRLAERMVQLDRLPAINSSAGECLSQPSASWPNGHVDDLCVDEAGVLERLRTYLNDERGMILVSSALVLAGFSSSSYGKHKFVARALRVLGWERGRYRLNGALQYAYARGTSIEREVALDRSDGGKIVVKRRELR